MQIFGTRSWSLINGAEMEALEVSEGLEDMREILGHKYFRIEEVSNLLGVSTRKVGDMLREGEIPARKIGGVWHVSQLNLTAWLESPDNQGPEEWEDDED